MLSGHVRRGKVTSGVLFVLIFDLLLIKQLLLLFVAEVLPVKPEDRKDGNYIDPNVSKEIDQVDQEVIVAHPQLDLERSVMNHIVDGKRATKCDTIANRERNQRAFEETSLSLELSLPKDARYSHMQLCVDNEQTDSL